MSGAPDRDRRATDLRWITNHQRVRLDELPRFAADELAARCDAWCSSGRRLVALTRLPTPTGSRHELLVVLADDLASRLGLARAEVDARGGYPALTPTLPQAQAFERELFERWGIFPEGHPWLKPLRMHAAFEPAGSAGARPHSFFKVEGEGVHEVAVGPVHAGVIEPGHFRFQCFGEEVLHLEIQLGYQHRGALARMLAAGPTLRRVLVESLAGDSVVGHALAYSGACEALAGAEVTLPAHALRGVALELERVANHVGDLGALCNDIGFLPGSAWLGRLRGEFLNVTLELSGNRLGRGLVRPGGVDPGAASVRRPALLERIAAAERDFARVADLVLDHSSVAARFEHTGTLTHETAEALGLVGPVARASGCDRDVRRDHPAGIYRFTHVPVALGDSGDVMARAQVRILEARRSLLFVREQLAELTPGELAVSLPPAAGACVAVALVEGWRGEIAHLAVTSDSGDLSAYQVVDPSFHNWFGLALAMRGNPISDFPLCNKSFNLSYAGHDL